MSCVADLMSPVELTLCSAQSLETAAPLFKARWDSSSNSERAALVLSPVGEPLGVLTCGDMAAAAAANPQTWPQLPCVRACPEELDFLRAEQPVEGVLWRYRAETVRPLLVLNGKKPVGIVYPAAVFRWCLDHPDLDFTRFFAWTNHAMPAPAITAPGSGAHVDSNGPNPTPNLKFKEPLMPLLIRDLLRPLEPSVCETQSLEAARQALDRAQSEHLIVRDLHDRPAGVITHEDITAFQELHPGEWFRRRCAQLVAPMPALLSPEDSPETCVQYYRDHGIRPVVVADDQGPVGLLHPTDVFQWCAERGDAAVQELADQACGLPHRPRRDQHAPLEEHSGRHPGAEKTSAAGNRP